MPFIRVAVASSVVTAIGFAATLALLGRVAMSQATADPVGAWSRNLVALGLCAMVVGGAAFLAARLAPDAPWWWIPAAVVAWQAVGSAFVAPLAIGELRLTDAPRVLAIVSGLGALPVAAGIGAYVERYLRTTRAGRAPLPE